MKKTKPAYKLLPRIALEERANNSEFNNRERVTAARMALAKYDLDPDKDDRLAQGFCRVCCYMRGMRLAGQAFTRRECDICECDQMFSSTYTLRACLECAIAHEVCRDCLADVHDRVRDDIQPPRAKNEREAFWAEQHAAEAAYRERFRARCGSRSPLDMSEND